MEFFRDLFGSGERLFGGTDNSAQKEQIKQNEIARRWIEQQTALGKEDIAHIIPWGDQARNRGYNEALAMLGNAAVQQLNTFQDGNVAAQQVLSNSMPQYRNALLGLPVDYSQFQPVRVNHYPEVLQSQLPEYGEMPRPRAPEDLVTYTGRPSHINKSLADQIIEETYVPELPEGWSEPTFGVDNYQPPAQPAPSDLRPSAYTAQVQPQQTAIPMGYQQPATPYADILRGIFG